VTTPYFMRDWKLTVTPLCSPGAQPFVVDNRTGEDNALKVTFEIEQATNVAWWFADICVYNCLPVMSLVIQKDDPVTLEAGFQNPASGVIFTGRVFQPTWERVNETDYKLTLHCLVGLFEDESGFVSTTIPARSTYSEAVKWVAAKAKPNPILIEQLDEQLLSPVRTEKGEAYSGRARAFFDEVAIHFQTQMWISFKGLNIRTLASKATVPDTVFLPPYSPATTTASTKGAKYTLLGTPQQVQYGVAFRVMLDSSISLGSLIKIENALVKRILQVPGKIPYIWSPTGLFAVSAIRHVGDSRGTDWFTEVLAVTQNFLELLKRGVQAS
jgi:hypothetical protein